MNTSQSNILNLVKVLVLGLVLSVGIQYILAQTSTAAPGNPPDCPTTISGCNAPINAGETGQVKVGGLTLNTGGAATGLVVHSGNVGIGTSSPYAKLDVVGTVKATGLQIKTPSTPLVGQVLTAIDTDGNAQWRSPYYSQSSPGLLIQTTPGSYSWTPPPGVTSVDIEMCGPGGLGRNVNGVVDGGGGGGGAYVKATVAVTPGLSIPYRVGYYGNTSVPLTGVQAAPTEANSTGFGVLGQTLTAGGGASANYNLGAGGVKLGTLPVTNLIVVNGTNGTNVAGGLCNNGSNTGIFAGLGSGGFSSNISWVPGSGGFIKLSWVGATEGGNVAGSSGVSGTLCGSFKPGVSNPLEPEISIECMGARVSSSTCPSGYTYTQTFSMPNGQGDGGRTLYRTMYSCVKN